ncbi:alpha/beta fold hydrolase [Hydrogenophaga atypica]|uniref:Alpha/beta fold hydrolase n=1 Tax=Hydrogenophaga atypica TaxID=249409 RepID=A0ABW2QGL7_9BURK
MTARAPQFCSMAWAGRPVAIEHQWIEAGPSNGPLLVFLHEGLGSVSMWRDFPSRLCERLGWQGLVYSRPGYGQSTPRPLDEPLPPDFLERQALEVLPALLQALGVDGTRRPLWLLGHSDGGSIALIHAAHHTDSVAGLVVLAPHIMVEDVSVASIAQAREAYQTTDLRERLARHHRDPDSAFWGWNDVWLSPAFRDWSIEAMLPALTCPVLAVQGQDDEYGTLQQVFGIAAAAPHTTVEVFASCGHSPHKDQTERLLDLVTTFTGASSPNHANI